MKSIVLFIGHFVLFSATKVAALLEEERNETHKTPSGRSPTTSESSTGITGGNTGATGGNYGGATGGVTGVNYGGVTGGNYGSNYGVTGGNYGGVTGGVTSGNYDYSSSAIQPGVSANESIVSFRIILVKKFVKFFNNCRIRQLMTK